MRVYSSFQSVIGGVSQQVKSERRDGQHSEQLNFLSDKVRGNARRHGSKYLASSVLAPYTEEAFAADSDDAVGFQRYEFTSGLVDYVLLYRTETKPANSNLPAFICFNKETNAFVPVNTTNLPAAVSTNGVRCVINAGDYLFFAANGIKTSRSTVKLWESTSNLGKIVVWIRGGTYNRTFTITVMTTSGQITASYTTMSATYGGTLDTSGVPWDATDRAKQLEDIHNAYTTAVNAHTRAAAADIQPANIAAKLVADLASKGVSAYVSDSSVVLYENPSFTEVQATDGGNGEFIRGVGATIQSSADVTNKHYDGKIVRVFSPADSGRNSGYYLIAKGKGASAYDARAVIWEEGAGDKMTISGGLFTGLVYSGTLYLWTTGGTPPIAGTHPVFKQNAVGDENTNPLPFFAGMQITFLGMFQDRLVVGSGATLNFSRVGDYLNFFRTSVLTYVDDDPFDAYALGSEDDTLLEYVPFDRNFLLFGKKRQYIVPGRAALTPSSHSISVTTGYENVVEAPPIFSSTFVYFAKSRNETISVYQMQVSSNADVTEAFEISTVLDTYLKGRPCELAAVTSPNMLLMRTDKLRNGLYTYTYLDDMNAQTRLYDSWSKWEWDVAIGTHIGFTVRQDDVIVFTIRKEVVEGIASVIVVADSFVVDGDLSNQPYLDSWREYPVASGWLSETSVGHPTAAIAFNNKVDEFLMGAYTTDKLFFKKYSDETNANRIIGMPFTSSITLTNPYVKDDNNKARWDGSLIIDEYFISIDNTVAAEAFIDTENGTENVLDYSGVVPDKSNATLSVKNIHTDVLRIPIKKDNRDFNLTINSKHWLPLTMTAIQWFGEWNSDYTNDRR